MAKDCGIHVSAYARQTFELAFQRLVKLQQNLHEKITTVHEGGLEKPQDQQHDLFMTLASSGYTFDRLCNEMQSNLDDVYRQIKPDDMPNLDLLHSLRNWQSTLNNGTEQEVLRLKQHLANYQSCYRMVELAQRLCSNFKKWQDEGHENDFGPQSELGEYYFGLIAPVIELINNDAKQMGFSVSVEVSARREQDDAHISVYPQIPSSVQQREAECSEEGYEEHIRQALKDPECIGGYDPNGSRRLAVRYYMQAITQAAPEDKDSIASKMQGVVKNMILVDVFSCIRDIEALWEPSEDRAKVVINLCKIIKNHVEANSSDIRRAKFLLTGEKQERARFRNVSFDQAVIDHEVKPLTNVKKRLEEAKKNLKALLKSDPDSISADQLKAIQGAVLDVYKNRNSKESNFTDFDIANCLRLLKKIASEAPELFTKKIMKTFKDDTRHYLKIIRACSQGWSFKGNRSQDDTERESLYNKAIESYKAEVTLLDKKAKKKQDVELELDYQHIAAQAYSEMSLVYHALGIPDEAIYYMSRALPEERVHAQILKVVYKNSDVKAVMASAIRMIIVCNIVGVTVSEQYRFSFATEDMQNQFSADIISAMRERKCKIPDNEQIQEISDQLAQRTKVVKRTETDHKITLSYDLKQATTLSGAGVSGPAQNASCVK